MSAGAHVPTVALWKSEVCSQGVGSLFHFVKGKFILISATALLASSPVSASCLTVGVLGLGLQLCAIAPNFLVFGVLVLLL